MGLLPFAIGDRQRIAALRRRTAVLVQLRSIAAILRRHELFSGSTQHNSSLPSRHRFHREHRNLRRSSSNDPQDAAAVELRHRIFEPWLRWKAPCARRTRSMSRWPVRDFGCISNTVLASGQVVTHRDPTTLPHEVSISSGPQPGASNPALSLRLFGRHGVSGGCGARGLCKHRGGRSVRRAEPDAVEARGGIGT